jgi:hypothetical protein
MRSEGRSTNQTAFVFAKSPYSPSHFSPLFEGRFCYHARSIFRILGPIRVGAGVEEVQCGPSICVEAIRSSQAVQRRFIDTDTWRCAGTEERT